MNSGLLRGAAAGFALGAGWGVAARVWMRLMATDPEFSWSGTLAIVGLSAVLGLGVGLAGAARRQGRRRWWQLAVLPGLPLFAGQGLLFLPAFTVGGVLLARPRAWARVATAAAVAGPAVGAWWASSRDQTALPSPLGAQLALLVGFPVLATALAVAGRQLWGPGATTLRSSAALAAAAPEQVAPAHQRGPDPRPADVTVLAGPLVDVVAPVRQVDRP